MTVGGRKKVKPLIFIHTISAILFIGNIMTAIPKQLLLAGNQLANRIDRIIYFNRSDLVVAFTAAAAKNDEI